MICKCPVCKKTFDVLWTNRWAYKRGNSFLCSYGCMIRMDKGDTKMEKFTKEQKQECIRIALEGGDPKAYLKSLGSTAPDKLWYYMKTQLLKKDPETYEKLAGGRKRADNVEPMKPGQKIPQPDKVICPKARETVETPEGGWTPAVQVYGAVNIETPEPEKVVVKPMKPAAFEYKVTGITTSVGNFNYWKKSGYVDWTDLNGETVSMNLDEWREFLKVIPEAMKVLGVEL